MGIPLIFSGEHVAVDTKSSTTQVNMLVNKYQAMMGQGKMHWPLGLGHYLLTKLDGGTGQYVFMNSQAVGLSSHMDMFKEMAVKMPYYQKTLAKLAAGFNAHSAGQQAAGHKNFVPPPEWNGD